MMRLYVAQLRGLPAFALAVCAVLPARAGAQTVSLDGGFSGGSIAASSIPPDRAYAKLMTPAEFAASEPPVRRRVMAAWAVSSPENAGEPLLPLLDAGLKDADREVRSQALRVLDRIELHAFSNRAMQKPVGTDVSQYPTIFDTLVRMLDDPDPDFRAAAVACLANMDQPSKPRLEPPLLNRLAKEPEALVRARIVTALSPLAGTGSPAALEVVIAALDDANAEIRFRAVVAMQAVRRPEGLPKVARQLSAQEPLVRLAAVRALAAYGDAAAPYRPALEERFAVEPEPNIRNEMERLLRLLPRPPA
jgi:HEAT repeat protein